MDKIKIGIPRSLFYYYKGDLWITFFEKIGIDVIVSPPTNKLIMDSGINKSVDEMCISMKNFIGHVSYLQDKCDYILIPRIDNYGLSNQTCTNFLAVYDIINNLFDVKILNYNIDIENKKTEEKGFIQISKKLGINKKQAKALYKESLKEVMNKKDKMILKNKEKLNSKKIKILLVGHPYNMYDEYIGKPIIKFLEKNNVEIIYSNLFPESKSIKKSLEITPNLYFKYNKENIGSIKFCENKIDGIIFLSTFPCGPDSLANEVAIRKIKIPYINLIIDEANIMTGFITRIESFIDILERNRLNEKNFISANG